MCLRYYSYLKFPRSVYCGSICCLSIWFHQRTIPMSFLDIYISQDVTPNSHSHPSMTAVTCLCQRASGCIITTEHMSSLLTITTKPHPTMDGKLFSELCKGRCGDRRCFVCSWSGHLACNCRNKEVEVAR